MGIKTSTLANIIANKKYLKSKKKYNFSILKKQGLTERSVGKKTGKKNTSGTFLEQLFLRVSKDGY